MRKTEGTGYVDVAGAAIVAETATSGDHGSRRSRRCRPACRSLIQSTVACHAWPDPDSLTIRSVTHAVGVTTQRWSLRQLTLTFASVAASPFSGGTRSPLS